MDVQMSFASFVRGILDPESSAGSGPGGAGRATNIGQTRRSKTRPHGPWPLGAGIERGELHRLQGGALKKNGTNQSAVKRSEKLKHHETSETSTAELYTAILEAEQINVSVLWDREADKAQS